MLVGEDGCGKSAIINERIRTVCSGEVAEVLSLTINANRSGGNNVRVNSRGGSDIGVNCGRGNNKGHNC